MFKSILPVYFFVYFFPGNWVPSNFLAYWRVLTRSSLKLNIETIKGTAQLETMVLCSSVNFFLKWGKVPATRVRVPVPGSFRALRSPFWSQSYCFAQTDGIVYSYTVSREGLDNMLRSARAGGLPTPPFADVEHTGCLSARPEPHRVPSRWIWSPSTKLRVHWAKHLRTLRHLV